MSWRWLDLVSHSQQQGKAAELEQEHQQLQPPHAAQAAQYQLPRMARAAAGKRRQVQASGWALHQNGTSSSLRGVAPAGGEVQSLPQPPELGAAGREVAAP